VVEHGLAARQPPLKLDRDVQALAGRDQPGIERDRHRQRVRQQIARDLMELAQEGDRWAGDRAEERGARRAHPGERFVLLPAKAVLERRLPRRHGREGKRIEHDLRRFRVAKGVELGGEVARVADGGDRAAHKDKRLHLLREGWVQPAGERNIGQRPQRDDRDLARRFIDQPQQRDRRRLRLDPPRRTAVATIAAQAVRAVNLLFRRPEAGDQRLLRPAIDRDTRAHHIQNGKYVRDNFIYVYIARDRGDGLNAHVRPRECEHQRLRVVDSSVSIDNKSHRIRLSTAHTEASRPRWGTNKFVEHPLQWGYYTT